MLEILEYVTSSFWVWAGSCVILSLFLRSGEIACIIGFRCLMRHMNIRKHGWPPAHLDADGDFMRVK